MYLADYHVHSRFSPDARPSMTEQARAALAAGLQEICFTDHVEPVAFGGCAPRSEPYDWQSLRADFSAAQTAMAGTGITLRLGMELGEPHWDAAGTERLLRGAPEMDFVIGSVHLLSRRFGGENLYCFVPKDEETVRLALEDYLEQVEKLVGLGGFCVLGHLTLPVRYFQEGRGIPVSFDPCEPQLRRLFRTLTGKGIGIEVNMNRGNTPLPDEKWLRLYRSLGGEIITLGTDAHRPEDVGRFIREGQALLRRCGFRRFCTFSRREPVWHRL